MLSVDEIANQYVAQLCDAFPVTATALGRHDRDTELGEYNAEVFESHARAIRSLQSSVPNDGSIDARALDGVLGTSLLELEDAQQWRRNPERAIDTALTACFSLLLREFAPLEERVAALEARLQQLPNYLRSAQATWSDVPEMWASVGIDTAQAGAAFLRDELTPALAEAPNRDAALRAAIPAAEALDAVTEHLTTLDGAAPWPAGEAMLDARLRTEHHLDASASDIAQQGHALVRDTLGALDEVDREWRTAVKAFKSDHPSPANLLRVYRDEVERARAHVEATRLTPTSSATLEVRATPRFWVHSMPYAAYDPPGYFETDQRGIFWLTVPEGPGAADLLLGHGWGSIVLTVVHEAFPGHHLQMTYTNEVAGLVRTVADSTLTIEGWAHYCEQLLWEDGYYGDDPRLRIFQLKDQLWRAARVVLDMELHSGQRSIESAVDYLVDVADLEQANAVAEVRRYTSTPTYQICYAIGKREIIKLREARRGAQGGSFELGAFHAELLGYGSLAVPLIADAMLA